MRAKTSFFLWAVATGSWIYAAGASEQTGTATVYAVNGSAQYSSGGSDLKPLKPGQVLPPGTTVKTGADSSVDLVLQSSGSAVHLNPGSELGISKLSSTPCGEQTVTDTGLDLKSGSLVGCTGKLPALSKFDVNTCKGPAHCNGTQYEVSASGDVTVISGEISLDFDPKGKKGGDENAMVSAGETFDPATGKVVPTSPKFLKDIIADVKTMQDIEKTFKVADGTIEVFTEECASPIHGHHGHDHDHDHDHGKDGHDHDHDDHGYGDGHGGFGNGYAGGDSGYGK
jgi:hypothetical protein